MTCTAVTRRASEGPCEFQMTNQLDRSIKYSCWRRSGHHREGGSRSDHPFLGPVLERCGHEESEHGEAGRPDIDGTMFCLGCYETDAQPYAAHAYEEEAQA